MTTQTLQEGVFSGYECTIYTSKVRVKFTVVEYPLKNYMMQKV